VDRGKPLGRLAAPARHLRSTPTLA
jgi:hypothetical protein